MLPCESEWLCTGARSGGRYAKRIIAIGLDKTACAVGDCPHRAKSIRVRYLDVARAVDRVGEPLAEPVLPGAVREELRQPPGGYLAVSPKDFLNVFVRGAWEELHGTSPAARLTGDDVAGSAA